MITVEETLTLLDKALGSTTWTTVKFNHELVHRDMIYERCRGYDKIRVAGYRRGVVVSSLKRKSKYNYLETTRDLRTWLENYLRYEKE